MRSMSSRNMRSMGNSSGRNKSRAPPALRCAACSLMAASPWTILGSSSCSALLLSPVRSRLVRFRRSALRAAPPILAAIELTQFQQRKHVAEAGCS